MQKLVKILVVEHDLRKVAMMAAALDPEIRKLPVRVELIAATNLSMALVMLASCDAAITNSALCEGHEAPAGTASGRSVVQWCFQQRKPAVFLAQHEPRNTVDAAWCAKRGLEAIDMAQPWVTALYLLLYTMVAADMEECRITDHGIEVSGGVPSLTINPDLVAPFTVKRTRETSWTPSPVFYRMMEMGFKPLWTE